MRIIGGKLGGRKLLAAKNFHYRPTLDIVKEGIFNIVGDCERDIVLDLFSGTGSLGIEALSRGADKAVFVDSDFSSISVLKKNLNILKVNNGFEIFKMDFRQFVSYSSKKKMKFNKIFIDPPFKKKYWIEVINLLSKYDILEKDGVIIVEYPANVDVMKEDLPFTIIKNKKYGNTCILILKGVNNV